MLVTDEAAGAVDRVFLRNLADHAAARQIGPDGAGSGRVAGPYVAYALPAPATTTVVVVDWRTGAETYRVSVPYAGDGPRPGLDLQEDGTLAVVSRPVLNAPADLGWASAADPALHVIAHDAIFESVVRIANGQILYTRPGVELALANIADGGTRAVSFKTHDLVNADFDGTRVAYATSHCVYLDSLAGPAPTAPPIGTCPQLDLTATLDTYSQPVVKAQIGCASTTEPACPGTAVFRTYPEKGRRPVILKTIRFHVAVGHERTVRFKLSRQARAKLRAFDPAGGSGSSVDVQVVATTTDTGHVRTVARDDTLLNF